MSPPPRRRRSGPRTRAARPLLLLLSLLAAGCAAARAPGPGAPPPGWSVELAALLPAINACVTRADGAAASGVTRAWPMARGLAGVRVLRADGSRLDCVASGDGGRIVLTQPVAAGSRQTEDEAAPLYTPPDHRPPEGPCVGTVPAVVGARQIGWLSYGTCPGGEAPARGRPRPAPRPPAV